MTDQPQGEMPTPTPTETESVTPPQPTAVTAESLQAELERVQKALKEANREAAARRKRLDELESAEKQRQEAEMSETDKLRKMLEDEKAARERYGREVQTERIKSAVISEATRQGFNDPEDAYRLISLETIEIEDVKGKLEALVKAKPYLIRSQRAQPMGASNPGAATSGETDAQRRARLFGGGNTLFDAQSAYQRGGGVIWNKPKEE